MSNIIGTEEFTKRLDSWLLRSDQKDAEFLYKNKDKIPAMFQSYTRPLYRGMILDLSFTEPLNKNGFVALKGHTSWTKDRQIALRFMKDPSMKVQDKNGVQAIITKTIPRASQLLDIDSFVLFMGVPQLEILGYDEINLDSAMKEKEVLIAKGLKIAKNDVEFLD